jgi:hypothetical protein
LKVSALEAKARKHTRPLSTMSRGLQQASPAVYFTLFKVEERPA